MEQWSTSPDGRFVLWVAAWEARMSHWIQTPQVREAPSDLLWFHFQDAHWSVESARWSEPDHLHLQLRKYPGDHQPTQIYLTLHCGARTGSIQDGAHVSFAQIEQMLNQTLS